MKKTVFISSIVASIIALGFPSFANESYSFVDLPKEHWATEAAYKLVELNVVKGIDENTFGLGQKINKGEFNNWINKVLYKDMDIKEVEDKTILTREEMAKIVIEKLGYSELANIIKGNTNIFNDVNENYQYIMMVNDMGIITGSNNKFNPKDPVTKEQAAVVLSRIYERINSNIKDLHGFYAIKSYEQKDMIKGFSSVGFGWSKLEQDKDGKIVLNTSKANNNIFSIPEGYSEPLNIAVDNKTSSQLMVFLDNNELQEKIFFNESIRKDVINQIVNSLNNDATMSFNGVIIDFESMKGEKLREGFNLFLSQLKDELIKNEKSLVVAVHPRTKPGTSYYDGYDFKHIGDVADKIILMAHDYYPKKLTKEDQDRGYTITPLTPINDVYYALKYITDKNTGVKDLDKVLLQISFDSVQWKLKDGKVLNDKPYSPAYDLIRKRLIEDSQVEKYYSYGNPYIKFKNLEDGTDNIVWYENEQSIKEKINLSKIFGINGVSLWRLGNIPDFQDPDIELNIWNELLNMKGEGK